MSTNDHTARPESWERHTRWAATNDYSDCLMELRARVERLEQAQQPIPRYNLRFRGVDLVPPIDCPDSTLWIAERVYEMAQQQQPAPSTPAGQGELVRCVANAAARARCDGPYEPEQAAILAVADWLASQDYGNTADLLRREVER